MAYLNNVSRALMAGAVWALLLAGASVAAETSDAALAAFRQEVADIRARQAEHPPANTAETLHNMRELDIAVEKGMTDVSIGHAKGSAWEEFRAQARGIQDANTARLKLLIPKDGWFTTARDGKGAAADGFMLVQHSGDLELERQVLPRLAQSVTAGEIGGQAYALVYDRIQVQTHKPQRFGSQFICIQGKMALYTLEQPGTVDVRRKAIGMTQTLDEYIRYAGIAGRPCSGEGA